MIVRAAIMADAEAWAAMRAELWPEGSLAEHRADVAATLDAASGDAAAFIALGSAHDAIGFAEAVLRRDYVNGCDTSPVAFLEGIYVAPAHRGAGVGRALADAVRAWAGSRGCTELASDALLDNHASHAFHAAIGFVETERVVYFRQLV